MKDPFVKLAICVWLLIIGVMLVFGPVYATDCPPGEYSDCLPAAPNPLVPIVAAGAGGAAAVAATSRGPQPEQPPDKRKDAEEHCKEYKEALAIALLKAHLMLRALEDAKDAYQMMNEMYLAAQKAQYATGVIDIATLGASLLGGVPGQFGKTISQGLIKKLLGDLGAAAVKAGTKEAMKDVAAVLAGYPDDLNLTNLVTKPIAGSGKFPYLDGALKKWAESQLKDGLRNWAWNQLKNQVAGGQPSTLFSPFLSVVKDGVGSGMRFTDAVNAASDFTAKMAGNMLSVFSLVKGQMDWSHKVDAIRSKMMDAYEQMVSAELELKDLQDDVRSKQENYDHCIGLWTGAIEPGGRTIAVEKF